MPELKKTEIERVSLDDMAQDLFGLNIRGVKSIWTLFSRPRRYYEAAKDPAWQKKYTPSIRLWVSIVAASSFLQFLWIGTDTPLVSAYAQGYRDAGVVPIEGWTYEELGERAALWIYGITPIAQAIALVFLALIYRFWARPTSFALRQRYVFATLVPSATLMLFIVPTMRLMSLQMVSYFGYVIAVIAYLTDFTTSYRGVFADASHGGRVWRAGLLAGVILILNIAAAIFIQIAGIILVRAQYTSM